MDEQAQEPLNPRDGKKPPLVLITGPTAVGKTETAIRLAERLDGEIVSADSRQLYRGMDIGTAKPTPAELARAPHHLIDVADPDENWSLSVFQEAAREAIAGIHARGKLPLLVGGTGQYVRAVVEGWQPPRTEPDPRLRAALEAWAAETGSEELHRRLRQLDPEAAGNIDYRNLRRTVRALEVILTTGRRFSDQRRQGPSPYRLLTLGLNRPRPELYARVDRRIEAMIEQGLVDEVRRLLAIYPPDLPAFSAIGYREIVDHLLGQISLDEAVIRIKHNTRVFIRRQANWFKPGDPAIHWFEAGEDHLELMINLVQRWLSGGFSS